VTESAAPPDRARRGPDWNTIAAILGGVAAVITACVGVLAFAADHLGTGGGSGPSATATPAGRSAMHGSGAASAPAPGGWVQVWQGPFLFDNNGVSFDHEPPLRNSGGDFDIYSGGSSAIAAGVGGGSVQVVALGPGDPSTPEACAAKLAGFGTGSVSLDSGKRICVHTALGRVALMTVVGSSTDGPDAWNVTATVWRPAG